MKRENYNQVLIGTIKKLWEITTHLNSAIKKTIILSWTIEKSFCVRQLMLLSWRGCENVHREISSCCWSWHVCWRRMWLERCANSHFIDSLLLNYHVVISNRRLFVIYCDHHHHLLKKFSNQCGQRSKSNQNTEECKSKAMKRPETDNQAI